MLIERILERAVENQRGDDHRGSRASLPPDRIRIRPRSTGPTSFWQVGAMTRSPMSRSPYQGDRGRHRAPAARRKVDVILVGLQYAGGMAQNPHYLAVRDMLRQTAAREKVVIVRRDEAMQVIKEAKREGGGLLPDEFEQTEAGYTCLAQYVARAIALGVFGKALRRDDGEE